MEMDALTRRQAEKVEFVLRDLVRDLELISRLPLDLSPWSRKLCLNMAQSQLHGGGGGDLDEADDDVRAAELIYGIAERYGNPVDVDNNEVILQMAEFAELEKGLLDAATVVGSVDDAELTQHRMLFRAVLDTLYENDYLQSVKNIMERHPNFFLSRDSSHAQYLNDVGVEALRLIVEVLVDLVVTRNKTTVNEDIHNYRILHEAVNKEKTTSADVKALKREYQEVKETRRAEVEVLDAEIRQLEEEIEYTNSAVAVELEVFFEMSEKLNEERCAHNAKSLQEIKQMAQQSEEKLVALVAQNQEKINALRSQRAKKEAAVSAAITEYDEQMAALTAATANLNKEAEEDTEVIVVLDEELAVLRTEKKEYELEKFIESMRDKHYEDMNAAMEQHTRTIQACFRSYLARVKFQKAQSSLKKKRKKKKS